MERIQEEITDQEKRKDMSKKIVADLYNNTEMIKTNGNQIADTPVPNQIE